jgi:perosamine synthetase
MERLHHIKKGFMKKYIPVNQPLLDGNEKRYLLECIDSGWISSEGPFVKKFEAQFAQYVGRKHAIAVNNGTSAIDAAVEALGIGPGDEVIMPTFTIISCIHQIVRSGATPVLIDSLPLNWNMNVSAIEEKITNSTKAIMVVHIYGLPVDMTPVLDLAKKYGLKVIEDAAEMHGQSYMGKACGGFGDVSTFSFYPNKHITTGEGGMIVTDDDDIAEECRSLRNLFFNKNRRFVHEKLGWNLRMTNIQAAIGLAQLERLDEFVKKKRIMGAIYTECLQDVPGIELPISRTDYADNIYWVYGIVLKDYISYDAADMIRLLDNAGIGTRPFFYPMHKQPILIKKGFFKNESYPVAERLSERGFYIPSGLGLTESQMDFVSSSIKKILT